MRRLFFKIRLATILAGWLALTVPCFALFGIGGSPGGIPNPFNGGGGGLIPSGGGGLLPIPFGGGGLLPNPFGGGGGGLFPNPFGGGGCTVKIGDATLPPLMPLIPCPPGVGPIDLPKCIGALAPIVGSALLPGGLPIAAPGLLPTGPLGPPFLGGGPLNIPLGGCLSPDGHPVPNPGPLEAVNPVTRKSSAPMPQAVPGNSNQLVDWVIYDEVSCNPDWHHICTANVDLSIQDSGWQVCRPIYDVNNNAGPTAGPDLNAHKWFVKDPVEPVNYRADRLNIRSNGNNVPPNLGLESVGSSLSLSAVGLRLIPSDADYRTRIKQNCVFTAAP